MNAMYPNMATPNSEITTNVTSGRYEWESGNVVNAEPSIRSHLIHLHEELNAQKNMIRVIGENLHGKKPRVNEDEPKDGPACVLEALEDIIDCANENSLALKTIINDLGIND